MRRSKNIMYLVALIIIMFPIILEQFGNPMTPLMQTITLLIGLAILFIGKLQVVNAKKRAGQRTPTTDTLLLALMLFMAVYIIYNYFNL